MKHTRNLLIFATLLAFASFCSVRPGENPVTPAMVGHWTGNAQIIVVWCQQTNLPVSVEIASNGGVTGKIGDATLTNGRMKRNCGWLGRKMNVKTDFIIVGNLQGPIIASEQISRRAVSIPINFANGTFVGGIHTSGTHVGGKKHMVLSAQGLVLARTNSP